MSRYDDTYNGWTNYQTWAVFTWLSNDPGSYEYAVETARDGATRAEMREAVEELYQLPTEGLAADLLGDALDKVDWDRIIEAFKEA